MSQTDDLQSPHPDADGVPAQADPAAELAQAQQLARDNHEAMLRAKAESENIRRRAQEDVSKAHKYGIEKFAEALVPVADSLLAALASSAGSSDSYREGIEITLRQLRSAFERNGLIELDPAGQKFDPHKHQAIAMVPSDVEANTVVSVMQRGYTIGDRVLRPALVTVSQGPAAG
ncbi:nucleotide exchange factor GrpE [soil metagenome]